jgi:hypothetical protein
MHGEIGMKTIIPDTRAMYCFDINHQGKGLRDLVTKGRSVTVFPRFSCADVAFDVGADILRGLGGPPAPVRGSVAGKMDDHLAAKLSPGDNLVMMGNLLRQSVDLFRGIPLGGGASEQDRAANDAFAGGGGGSGARARRCLLADCPNGVRLSDNARRTSARLLVAACGFCVALLMLGMRRFADSAFRPLQRHPTSSAKRRWVYNDETWKKLMAHESWPLCLLFFVVWERSSCPFEPTSSAF